MSDVDAILARKGGEVWTISPHETVLHAAEKMNDYGIGALVVIDRGRVVGMFTERDMLRRVVAHRLDPADVHVAQVMTHDVVTCHPGTRVEEARRVFMECRIRHMPVVDEHGGLIGMLSIGDLNAWELTGAHIRVQALEEYIYGTF
jgi:CBS domain-containing protein